MIERVTINKSALSLEQRIVAALGNPNNGSEALVELIREVEQAVVTAEDKERQERAKAVDLTLSPDLKAAHEAVVEAELCRSRLNAALPKLRDKLAGALEAERHARWLSEYCDVKTELDALVEEFAEAYPRLTSELVDLFYRVQQCDRKCSEVDALASNLNAEHRRLSKVELSARGIEAFSRDRPEIAKGVVLPDFDISSRTRWPAQTSTSFAAAYAETTSAPYHPGQHWADPEVVAPRREEAEREQRRQAEFNSEQTATQESARNEAERKRFARRR
jgi:hypothetical protein